MTAISLPLTKLKDIISVLEYIHPSSRSFYEQFQSTTIKDEDDVYPFEEPEKDV